MDTAFLSVRGVGSLERLPIADTEASTQVGWDSAGNDAPHDGNGIGNHAGDHTDHRMFLEVGQIPGALQEIAGAGLSIDELLQIRARIGRR